MNRLSDNQRALITIRWIMRGIGGLIAGLMVFMVAGYAYQKGSLLPEGKDIIYFLFAPIGYTLGLIIALKWEGIGGSIIICSVIGWHTAFGIVQGKPQIGSAIDLFMLPGVLFLALWYADRRLRREREAQFENPVSDRV